MVYEIRIYDQNWHLLNLDYKRFTDRQQAELRAEADCDWLGGASWEIRPIR